MKHFTETKKYSKDLADYDYDTHARGFALRNEHGRLIIDGTTIRGNDNRENIKGDFSHDVLFGEGNDDWLVGGWGNDVLYGGTGDDLLEGSHGNDFLYGGAGDDALGGGGGKDTFVFRTSDFGSDKILDFRSGEDKIDFRGSGLSWSDLKLYSKGNGELIIDAGAGNQIAVRSASIGTPSIGESDMLFGPEPTSVEHATPDTRLIIAIHGATANEGGKAVVVLKMSQPATEDVTVQLSSVLTGSASSEDFAHFSEPRTVTFKAGEIRKTVEIDIAQDNVDEWMEGFKLVLSNPDGALLGRLDSAGVYIRDDDDPPEISIGDSTVTEGGTAELVVEMSRASDHTIVAYWFTTDGTADSTDYSGIDAPRLPEPRIPSVLDDPEEGYSHIDRLQTLVFNPGETKKVINVDTSPDSIVEGDESFTVTLLLRHPSFVERYLYDPKVVLGSKHTATVTIADDDASPVVEPPESETVPSDAEPGEQDRLPLGTDDTLPQSNTEPENAPSSRAAVAGTPAADTMDGTSGADALDGLAGNDTVRGLGGDDRLWGRQDADTLYGNAGNDRLWGGRDGDELHGGVGKDHLYGGLGHDTLYGGRGDDTLHGGRLADRLHGGEGKDVLVGGHGRDLFVYDDADFGRDRIVDFEDGLDRLDFTGSGLRWSDLSVSNNGKGDAVVRVDGANGKIVLEGVDASLIDQNDFIF